MRARTQGAFHMQRALLASLLLAIALSSLPAIRAGIIGQAPDELLLVKVQAADSSTGGYRVLESVTLTGFLPDYRNPPAKPYQAVLRDHDMVQFTLGFHDPRLILTDAIVGEEMQGGVEKLDEASFALLLPTTNATDLDIYDNEGALVLTHPLRKRAVSWSWLLLLALPLLAWIVYAMRKEA